MGGFGSGWRRGRRLTIEDGITLDLAELSRRGFLENGRNGIWQWRRFDELVFEVGLIVDLRSEETAAVHILIRRRGEWERQTVKLVATAPTFGGVRYWFECPVTGKRARCLHLPPGKRQFASRAAFGLGYRSSQTCSKSWRDRMDAIARQCGANPIMVRRMFRPTRATA